MEEEEILVGDSDEQNRPRYQQLLEDHQSGLEEETAQEVITPEVVAPGNFDAPFRSPIGKSTVDLSIPENESRMKEEYDEYWNFGKKRGFLGIPYVSEEFKGERDKLRDKFLRKYHGMGIEEYEEARKANQKTIYGYSADLKGVTEQMDNNFQALSIPGLAWADFGMDAAGTLIPGMGKVDDRWDASTKMDNEVYQGARRVLSIVLPAIKTGGMTHAALAASPVARYPTLYKTLTHIGAYGLADGAVTLLSDTSEDHNMAKTVADMMPGWFGSKGRVPLPESWKTKESDSPEARKMLNFWENTVLSTVGTVLGAVLDAKNAIKTPVDFIEPLDNAAANYKQLELLKLTDSEDIIELQRLNTLLSSGKLNRQVERQIADEVMNLEAKLGMKTDLESTLKRKQEVFKQEGDAAARRKLADANPNQLSLDLDPDITPGVVDQSSSARSIPPPANVARNMADTTAIKNGTSKGDPAPIITEAMREKGLMVGPTSRGAVMGVALPSDLSLS